MKAGRRAWGRKWQRLMAGEPFSSPYLTKQQRLSKQVADRNLQRQAALHKHESAWKPTGRPARPFVAAPIFVAIVVRALPFPRARTNNGRLLWPTDPKVTLFAPSGASARR